MDYYEELGIERSATKDDISQAHRRLTKLLHPDQQTDEAIKVLADKQMRRLNSIVEVLVDPERRFRYDQHLQFLNAAKNPRPAESQQFRPILVPQQRFEWLPSRKTILLCLSSAAIGAIVMMCALLLWTNDWGGGVYDDRRPAEMAGNPASAPSLPGTNGSGDHDRTLVSPTSTFPPPASPVSKPPTSTTAPHSASSDDDKKNASAPKAKESTTSIAQTGKPASNPASSTPASQQGVQKGSPPAVKAVKPLAETVVKPTAGMSSHSSTAAAAHQPKSVLEGYWVYNPPKREASDPGYYVPEFIHLTLSSKGDGMQGNYEARYLGVPKSISSTVSFSLSTSDHQSQRFIWQGPAGSRGTFRVSLLDPDKLRIDWRTIVSGPQQGLTSGVATLIRQNP